MAEKTIEALQAPRPDLPVRKAQSARLRFFRRPRAEEVPFRTVARSAIVLTAIAPALAYLGDSWVGKPFREMNEFNRAKKLLVDSGVTVPGQVAIKIRKATVIMDPRDPPETMETEWIQASFLHQGRDKQLWVVGSWIDTVKLRRDLKNGGVLSVHIRYVPGDDKVMGVYGYEIAEYEPSMLGLTLRTIPGLILLIVGILTAKGLGDAFVGEVPPKKEHRWQSDEVSPAFGARS